MKSITITLNEQDQQAFLGLIDSALKLHGANALDVAMYFKTKMTEAAKKSEGAKQNG